MALDMSKYTKMAKVERKLPIIFMINEKMLSSERWDGGVFEEVVKDIANNLSHRSIDAVISIVSFGDEVHLWSGFKKYEDYKRDEWPSKKVEGKSVFNIALTLVKDMLEDIDTTPEGNYDPIVILISSDKVSPGYKKELKKLNEDGRFKNIQKIGIADLVYDGHRYRVNSLQYEMERHIPNILKEFAGENVALFVVDDDYCTWCTNNDYGRTDTPSDYTWYCPVLNMMELRYTEEGQMHTSRICKNDISDSLNTDLIMSSILKMY